MGVIIFELLYGRTPFVMSKEQETKDRIRSLKFTFPRLKNGVTYPDAEDLFRRIFVHPVKRISLEAIQVHPWLTKTLIIPQNHNNLNFK